MCDLGYLCANFGLPRPLCSLLRPDVRDRQTDCAVFRLDALALSVIATATWLAGCHTPVLYQNR